MPADTEFRLLGPLEVRVGATAVPLGSRQQRVVLTALLLSANEVVSRDRLIDAVWGECAPPTAVKALQVHVSQLRKALARERDDDAERVVTRPPGYALRVAPEEFDVATFEPALADGRAALDAGRPAVARTALCAALELWRGAALGDLALEPFARGEAERLEELRLAALELRVEADLALGAPGLVAELEGLVADHPLRERLRGHLMLALYRDDRQADALAAYRDGRRALVDELGIEPGAGLRDLHEKVLRQDPALDAPRAATARVEEVDDFVGRTEELTQLGAALERAIDGHGGVVLLAGEPGAGKSRLAARLGGRAERDGAQVLVGRCWESGGAPAYWPWVEALRSYVTTQDADTLRGQLGDSAAHVARLVPEAAPWLDAQAERTDDGEDDRFRLFDALGRFLRRAAEARPLVLLLDDLHAADAPSLLLLEFLAGRMTGARLLVIGAYRDTEVGSGDPMAATLADLERGANNRHLRLGGLAEEDIGRYLAAGSGQPVPASVARLIEAETEGNPLFVGEAVRLLVAEGKLEAAARATAWDFGVPDGLRAIIGRRLGGLGAPTRELLTVASVLGRDFRLDALEGVADLSRRAVTDVLDEAVAARIVEAVPGDRASRRFSHAVIRDVVYEALPAAELCRLHALAGGALEMVYGADAETRSAELAHHFCRAAEAGGDVAIAVSWARRAAERATELLAFEEAGRLYALALETLGSGGEGAVRCDLLLALGDVRSRAGDLPEGRASFRRAADIARAEGMPDQLARAALGYGGRFVWTRLTADPELGPMLDAALEALGEREDTLRVLLLARLAAAMRPGSARPGADPHAVPTEAVALGDQAVAIARRLGEPATLAAALDGRVMADWSAGNAPQRTEMAREIIALSEAAGDREQAFSGHDHALYTCWELGDLHGVERELAALERLAAELRQPAQGWELASAQGVLATSQGRFAEGEAAAARALELGRAAQPWNAPISHQLQLFTLRRAQGRLDEVRPSLEAAAREYPTYVALRSALGVLHLTLGADALARESFETLAADAFAGVHRADTWLLSMSLLAETCAWLRDRRRGAVLYDLLLPHAALAAVGAPDTSADAPARHLGLLAENLDRPERAIEHFRAAIEINGRMGARPAVAHSRADCARTLRRRAGPGDLEDAQTLLAAAEASYRELGMPTYQAEVARLRDSRVSG